jgi:hypothetical protein
MYKIINIVLILIVLLYFGTSCAEMNHNKENLPEQKKRFKHELSYYTGRPLDELLNESNYSLVQYIYEDEPVGKLVSVILVFSDGYELRATFGSLKYVKIFSESRKWDFSLVRKEIIYKYSVPN